MSELIRGFRQLTLRERRQYIQDLTQELTLHEWVHLRGILESRTCKFDIIAALPLELVIEIFSYLDPSAPWLYQQVSKKWAAILSNHTVLSASLRLWYGPEDPPLICERHNASETEVLRKKYMAMENFRQGRPIKAFLVEIPEPQPNPGSFEHGFQYCNGFVAFRHGREFIWLANLNTGTTSRHMAPDRTKTLDCTLTESHLFWRSNNSYLYAYDLLDGSTKSIRLPSNAAIACAADGDFVVYCLLATLNSKHAADHTMAICWQVSTNDINQFIIEEVTSTSTRHLRTPCGHTIRSFFVTANCRQRLVVFHTLEPCSDTEEHPSYPLKTHLVSPSGAVLKTSAVGRIMIKGRRSKVLLCSHMCTYYKQHLDYPGHGSLRPTNYRGDRDVYVDPKYEHDSDDGKDSATKPESSSQNCSPPAFFAFVLDENQLWKDRRYQASLEGHHDGSVGSVLGPRHDWVVKRLRGSTHTSPLSEEENIKSISLNPEIPGYEVPNNPFLMKRAVGDDRFMIVHCNRFFVVYAFDPDYQPPKGGISFDRR